MYVSNFGRFASHLVITFDKTATHQVSKLRREFPQIMIPWVKGHCS